MANNPRLSKTILEMKFMKKTKEKVEKEDADAEGRAMYANEITEKMIYGSNFIIEPSYVFCEELIEGRLSFRGMNPEIEKLMEDAEAAKREADGEKIKIEKMEKDICDEDMMDFYDKNVVNTMKKKFDKSRKRLQNSSPKSSNKNKKILKN